MRSFDSFTVATYLTTLLMYQSKKKLILMKVYFEMPLVNDVVRFLIEHYLTKFDFFLRK